MQRAQQAGATQAKAQLAIFPAGASAALQREALPRKDAKSLLQPDFPAETAASNNQEMRFLYGYFLTRIAWNGWCEFGSN